MAETKQQKLAREMSHKQGKANQSERDLRLEGSVMQALARGWLAGTAGLPGDLEGLARSGINLVGGNVDKTPALPTTDFFKEVLPGKQQGDAAVGTVGSLFGGVGLGTAAKGVNKAAAALPGALTQVARNAAVPRALSTQAGVIKAPGGNWLNGSVEDALKGLKGETFPNADLADPVFWGEAEIAAANRPLNNFIDKQLTRYVKNDMATERDPIRALAEKGPIHYAPEHSLLPSKERLAAGFPAADMGTGANARLWERQADGQVLMQRAGTYQKAVGPKWEANTWLDKTAPDAPVHSVMNRRSMPRDLGFDHLIDELRNATNPASGLPRELLIKPESLDRVSVPQAVEHVAKINAWRAAQKVAADQAIANNAATHLFKEYAENNPKGLKWVELKAKEGANPAYLGDGKYEDPAMQALKDALKYEGDTMGHCVGGYCDDVAAGKSRIYSLRDAKGQPHVTVEVAQRGMPDNWDEYMEVASQPSHTREQALRDYYEWDGGNTLSKMEIEGLIAGEPAILQIKGKGNRKPNDEYLPFVQDFVKSGKWSDVGDLNNTGLIHADSAIPWPANYGIEEVDKVKAGLGGYSLRKHLEEIDSKYTTPEAFHSWLGTKGFAKGGPVTADCSCEHKGYADGGAVHWDNTPGVNPQPQAAGGLGNYDVNQTLQAIAASTPRSAQAEHTARNTMSREDFLKKYGQTFVADDKGGNAASEVAGQDVGAYYDRYLAPGAKGDLRWRGGDDDRRIGIDDYTMPTFGNKYRDANPYFDAWDNVDPHPESQDLGGVGEFWRQIGRPVATAAAMYAGVGALGGAATAAGTGGSAGIGSGTVLGGGAATGAATAKGLAGWLGMSPGTAATMLNTGALNTGVGLARGQDFGTALKGGATSALLSPVGGFVGNAVGGGTLGTIAGRTAVGGLQGLATGRGLADGLQQGLTSGVVDSIGDYIGGLTTDQTGSNFAGKAVSGLTKSTLRGKKPGLSLDALATQYTAGKISDLSGLSPEMASVVVNLARTKKVSPVGALTALNNSRRTTRG